MARTWIITVLASGMLLALGSGCASPGDESGEEAALRMAREGQDVVRSITFVGNDHIKDKVLRKKVGFKVGDYLDAVLAELGRRSVEEHYRQKGYAYAQVSLNTQKLEDGEVIYTVEEGQRVAIKSVKFVGNEKLKTGDLKKVIKTSPRRWLVLPKYYTKEMVQADVERLRQVYYDRGFLNHSIRAEGEANVVFHIEEGPVYRVRDVIFTGNEYFEEEKLREDLELEAGEPYYQTAAEDHVERLSELYKARGFINAFVEQSPKFVLEGDENLVDVEFRILQGDQFRIGKIDITGNENTQEKVYRHILDEYEFTPGEYYNADLAPVYGGGDLEKRIRRMTLAEEAAIRPVDTNQPGRKDAQVNVKEGLTGMVMPGVGVSSDSGFIGRLIYQQRNFDITDWPESFEEFITLKSFRGAGQTLRITAEPGTQVSQYAINFSDPYFQEKPTRLDVSASSYERGRESYYEERVRGYAGWEDRLENGWRKTISIRTENVDVDDLDRDAPWEIRDVAGENLLAGGLFGISRELTDDEWEPTEGQIYGVSYEQLTGDHTFGILSANYMRYFTVHEDLAERKTVLSLKLLGASTVGDAPPFEKFYAGGTGLYGIRGFEYRGVSTRGLQTNVRPGRTPQREDPIGSDWIFIANTELAIPVVGDNLAWLLFVDSGAIDTGPYRASVGTGVQIMIPQWFGPVPMRFSIATPFMKGDEDETEIFSFSAGGLF